MRQFHFSTVRAAFAMLLALLVCGMFLPSNVLAQTWKWHSAGKLPGTGLCGYFWDEQTGVVSTGSQFFYTRDGLTWQQGVAPLAANSSIFGIRSFDGKQLYAAVSNQTANECWSSSDQGATWTKVLSISPKIAKEIDVFWNYQTNAPMIATGTVARMNSMDLIWSEDDSTNILARYSHDGGQSWRATITAPPAGWTGGFCAYADTMKGIFYIGTEDGLNPIILKSTDLGITWSATPPMPSTGWIDDIEGVGSRFYMENFNGIYTTANGGATWDSIGGPHRTGDFDDDRFCVYGCGGLIVTAFDDSGGVWTGSAINILPTIHSTFATTAVECDSSTLSINVDSFFVTGRVLVKLYGDIFGAFRLLGSDTVQASNGSIALQVQFLPKDLLQHVDSIAIIPLDFPCGPTVVHAFKGQATFVPAVANAPKAASSCAGGTASILFTDSGCEVLHVTSATSTWPGVSILPFDSTVSGADTIPLRIIPATFSGEQSYFIHLKGYYEPSGTPFDTVIEVAITFSHNVSTLAASARQLDFMAPAPCATWDTTIILRNTGCDTLTVSRDTLLSSFAWQIFPDLSKKVIYPDESDTLFIHFASKIPGVYPERLVYSFTGPTSGTDTIALDATVPIAGPAVALSPAEVTLGNRSFCEADTEIVVQVQSLGCDSLVFTGATLTNAYGFSFLPAHATILTPGDLLYDTVLYSPTQHGLAIDSLLLHYYHLDGTAAGDTMVVFSVNVIRGPAILQTNAFAINVGQTYECDERDTSVVIENTGCDTLCVSAIKTSIPWFVLAPGEPTAFCLGPGDRDTVHLQTHIDTIGHGTQNVSSLEITSDADNANALAPILLAREIEYPAQWELTISPPDSADAGGSVTYQIIQHGTQASSTMLPPDDTSVDFVLVFYDDLLSMDSVDQVDEPWAKISDHYRSADGFAHYRFHVSPMPTDSILATIHLTAYQARILSTQLLLDSIRFASNPSRPSDCIASASVVNSEFTIRTSCNGPLLSEALGGILTIDGVSPNPTTGSVSIRYTLRGASVAGTIKVEDALGRTVLEQMTPLRMGPNQAIVLDLSALPKGMYLARIEIPNAMLTEPIIRE